MILNDLLSNWIDSLPFIGYRDHYSFPFDINRTLPSTSVKIMEKCCNALDSLKIKYYLASGTALGIYRDGRLISHDNDIDVNVLGQIDFGKLNREFKKINMVLGRKLYFNGKLQQLIYYSKEEVLFDICFWEKKRTNLYNYCEKGLVRIHPFKYYTKFEKVPFYSRYYYLPSPVDKWLEMQYGSEWRFPKKLKGDWTKECQDLYPL